MACSESKNHESVLCRLSKFFAAIVVALIAPVAGVSEDAASLGFDTSGSSGASHRALRKPWKGPLRSMSSNDHVFLGQASRLASDSSIQVHDVEISSRGNLHRQYGFAEGSFEHAHSSSYRLAQAQPTGPEHRDSITKESSIPSTLQCIDYWHGNINDQAALCSVPNCDGSADARGACCSCNAGAQFYQYSNTQCIADEGLSANTTSKPNPRPYSMSGDGVVQDCMHQCWAMGLDCDAFTVINSGSTFEGFCYFRKGRLHYTPNYESYANTVAAAPANSTDSTVQSEGTPLCDDNAILSNINCTTNVYEAAPKIVTPAPPPVTQDDVFDNRDCFVKHIWWS